VTAVHAARRRLHGPPGDWWREHLRREVCRRELHAEAHKARGELQTIASHGMLHETHPLRVTPPSLDMGKPPRHCLLQMLSMANAGPNTNGSQVRQLGNHRTALQATFC
jgi:cyclophilin family peptidyl-prolyl cis-trans isomerase